MLNARPIPRGLELGFSAEGVARPKGRGVTWGGGASSDLSNDLAKRGAW